jgi:hypothetical protein
MDWTQTLTIISTIIAGAYYMHRDIKEDMKVQTARTDRLYEIFTETMKSQKEHTDKLYEIFTETMKSQTARTDKLYEMFIDSLNRK